MRKIVTTADGSSSIYISNTEEQYHSKHGAILEAKHVFIQAGLEYLISNSSNLPKPISIFEMGLGTGLNCILSFLKSTNDSLSLHYTGIEAFPVEVSEIKQLNFANQLGVSQKDFLKLHEVSWDVKHQINERFSLHKIHQTIQDYVPVEKFNLIYFDAFGSKTQPELWTKSITDKLFEMLQPEGVLVTYSVKGSFRRSLLASGFSAQKIPGPPGKREMLRAVKSCC